MPQEPLDAGSPSHASARAAYYLFRVVDGEAVAIARFGDRADAIRSAWLAERLGWRMEVRRRDERPSSRPGPWTLIYRTIEGRP